LQLGVEIIDLCLICIELRTQGSAASVGCIQLTACGCHGFCLIGVGAAEISQARFILSGQLLAVLLNASKNV